MSKILEYRKNLLAKVHIHRGCVELKRLEAWEGYLEDKFGVKSSAKLSINELKTLLDMLNGKDIKPVKDLAGREIIQRASKEISSLAQARKIEELRVAIGWSHKELLSFMIDKMHIIGNPLKLKPQNASKLIYILSKVLEYKKSKDKI
ncbi:phage protein GemA/Gp16 family protein [Campylobacter porcelli]|uniref:DUF1018 domain protein n=1 Tax=Campylobacter porcelli TaxID=1660073 RepID=A0A1X9SVG6_9BACT|nr:phage protein GemA/Gp16 family protein [Campylobacter sp. RM6137]ARR00304.1 DUF1018 domain protein [Campylobacter sp. RM6137]